MSNSHVFQPVDRERFKAKFGISPLVCTVVWNRIVMRLNRVDRDIPGFNGLHPIHIYYALLAKLP